MQAEPEGCEELFNGKWEEEHSRQRGQQRPMWKSVVGSLKGWHKFLAHSRRSVKVPSFPSPRSDSQ